MKLEIKLMYYILLLVLSSCLPNANETEQHDSTSDSFKDFVICQNYVAAIDSENNLLLIDLEGNEYRKIDGDISTLITLPNNNLMIAKKKGELKSYNLDTNQWAEIGVVKEDVLMIARTTDSSIYLITESEIINFDNKKTYEFDQSLNPQVRVNHLKSPPKAMAVDQENNIWLGFDYGEWGGDLMVFSTIENRYLEPKINAYQIELFPIESIASDKDKIFVFCGSGHSPDAGPILEFDSLVARIIFQSNASLVEVKNEEGKKDYVHRPGRNIDAGTIDVDKNRIYRVSGDELVEGNLSKDLSLEENWTVISELNLELTSIVKLEKVKKNAFVYLIDDGKIGVLRDNRIRVLSKNGG
uniref:Lipoprotein n=1 Tax=Roseihalotalea indica TaxID=2867963 RepID=A0AA49JGW1_9BACT|nr:hypothetical protein K4G66_00620 [Tunicatimonas sp. TK19036]